MKTLYLNFYGIGLELKSKDECLIENVRRDFSFFVSNNSNAGIKIEGIARQPDFKIIPSKIPFFRTRDALCYESHGIKYINYIKKALSIYDLKEETCKIICEEKNLLHEITYITILSRVGEKLDIKSIHRIHALGFTYKDNAALCLSPMYGGKTTLALGLLNNPFVKLISDDTPLINKELELLPFPTRIGVKNITGLGIPSKFCREIIRKRFGRKVLIDIEYFYPKIVQNGVPLKFIFIAKRCNRTTPKIKKAGLPLSMFALFRDMVLCRGVAQVKEYFIQKSIRDIILKMELFMSRVLIASKILQNFRPYILYLSKDSNENVKTILGFLEETF